MNEKLKFYNAYIECALWTEEEEVGKDAKLSDEARAQMVADCNTFLELAKNLVSPNLLSQAGHDFWLSRNGHGTGFWDRPEIYGEFRGDCLHAVAQSFGEQNVYLGDDNKVYIY